MKGFVFAAGYGSRLAPVTDHIPKPLLPVGNLASVGYALRLLAHHGISEVALNLHHLGGQIRESLGDGSAFGVNLVYSEEEEILGTGGGLKRMQTFLEDGPFVAINADVIADLDLDEAIRRHRESKALATLVVREAENALSLGAIWRGEDGAITQIIDARHRDERSADEKPYMFTGIHILDPRFLDYLPPDIETCIVHYGYKKALKNGEKLQAYVSEGTWIDVGTPPAYLQANFDALDRKLELRHSDPLAGYALAPKRDVESVVRMGENVQLGQDVRILEPVVLGDEAKVGDGAVVGPYACIGARALIGKGATVTQSVVLAGAKVAAEEVVKDAVVHKKASLQAER